MFNQYTQETSDLPKVQIDPELMARNAERLKAAKEKLGTHWVLHKESTYAVKYKDWKQS